MKEDWLNQNHIRNLDMMMMLNGWFLLHFQKRFNRCGLDGMPRKKVIRSQRQEIFYLPQINQSPTSTAFFAETLKRALKFADHFKKESVAVTYDLAITKTAMQMQATETPRYDKVFVALGAFHIELSFFSASGEYIAESVGPYILNEAKTMIVAKDLISFWH